MTTIASDSDSSTDGQTAGVNLDAVLTDVPEPQADLFRALYTENQQLRDRIDTLESEVDVQASNTKGAHSRVSDLSERVDDLETRSTVSNQGGTSTGEDTREDQAEPETWTPLDEIIALPEHLAERELTTNQERARFIAQDVRDYAEKCPAGLVIDSRTVTKVITAAEGTKPHTQTVARVMKFLADLGQDAVELTKRRGRKLVVFTPEVADRLSTAADHTRCDRGSGARTPEPVISG